MKIFISGGCKNGKSTFAQKLAKKLAADGRPLYYVATMDPHDDEDVARIARHLREREGWGFETVEQPTDLCAVLERTDPKGSYLFDSVTALVANEMFRADGSFDKNAGERVSKDILKFLDSVEKAKPQAFVQIAEIDPVETIQQMLREMKQNLNLGIGYAIPSDTIAKLSPLVNSVIK